MSAPPAGEGALFGEGAGDVAAGEEVPSAEAAARTCVLFVDDDPLAEMTLRRALRRLRVERPLWIARDGLEALEVLRSPSFPLERCVVLLDLNMPRMDGHELLREVRADPHLSCVPIVVMTTSDDPRDVRDAYASGALGYFVKPVSFTELVRHVGAVLEYWSRVALPPAKARSGTLR